jgi:hypothetical protein
MEGADLVGEIGLTGALGVSGVFTVGFVTFWTGETTGLEGVATGCEISTGVCVSTGCC